MLAPKQKSVKWMTYFLCKLFRDGELVLDMDAGTSMTGEGCLLLVRKHRVLAVIQTLLVFRTCFRAKQKFMKNILSAALDTVWSKTASE